MSSKLGIALTLGLMVFGAAGCAIGPKPDDPLNADSGGYGPSADAADIAETSPGVFADAASDGAGGGVPDSAAADAAADGGEVAADASDAADASAADATPPGDASDAADATPPGDATTANDGG
jgi:hypothetical protein